MKILLADDHPDLIANFGLWLEMVTRFEVVGIVTTAAELVEKIGETAPDVLLLDWELKGLGGNAEWIHLARHLHTRFPALHTILLSSQLHTPPHLEPGIIDGVISKTESPDRLLDMLYAIKI